jgi:hypothetical protein
MAVVPDFPHCLSKAMWQAAQKYSDAETLMKGAVPQPKDWVKLKRR